MSWLRCAWVGRAAQKTSKNHLYKLNISICPNSALSTSKLSWEKKLMRVLAPVSLRQKYPGYFNHSISIWSTRIFLWLAFSKILFQILTLLYMFRTAIQTRCLNLIFIKKIIWAKSNILFYSFKKYVVFRLHFFKWFSCDFA